MDLFRKTMKPVEQVLKDAGVKKDEIDDVSAKCSTSLNPRSTDLCFRRSSLSVVPLVSPRFSNSLRNTLTARSLLRVSTPTRLLPMVPLSRVVSCPAKLVAVMFFLSMSAP